MFVDVFVDVSCAFASVCVTSCTFAFVFVCLLCVFLCSVIWGFVC